MLRHALKRVMERLLRLSPRRPAAMRGRALVLAYHNIIPDDAELTGDKALHLRLGNFTRQLDVLAGTCQIIPLDALLAGTRSDQGPVVAITFDDAYRGAVELALPELARRGMPSTMFVAPGLLGAASFWWDEIAVSGAFSPERRATLLEAEAGRGDLIRRQQERIPALPGWYSCVTAEEMLAAAANGPVTLGGHSWSHPNLARLDPAMLEQELQQSLAWVRRQPVTTAVMAYPYGLASPAVGETLRRIGFSGGLLVDGGWLENGIVDWRLPRFNVPAGLSIDGLYLRLCGTIGLS